VAFLKPDLYELDMCTFIGPRQEFLKSEEVHRPFVIIGVESGVFDYAVGEQTGRASYGDLVFVPPGTLFKRKALEEITFHMLCFTAIAEHHPVFDSLPVGKVKISDLNRLSSTYSYLRNLWREYGSQAKKTSLAVHMLMDLLHLSILEANIVQKRKKATDPRMQRAVGYIQRHLLNELKIKDIADHLDIVPSDLTRRFRLEYGMTPMEYVTRLRLEEVKKLLLETDHTLDAIAALCGYESGSYLSRVFRAKVGINASDFRNKNQI
jgi:AraC-like DNA-binding protein